MRSNLKILLYGFALIAMTTSSAFASSFTLGANQQGNWGQGFYLFATGLEGEFKNETYRLSFDPNNGTADFGNVNNGLFDSVTFETALMNTFEVQKYDSNQNSYVDVAGDLSGSLYLGYHNVSFDSANNQAAALTDTSNGAGLALNINGTVDGNDMQFTAQLNPSYMDFDEVQSDGVYSSLVQAFGQDGVVGLGMSINERDYGTKIGAWVHNYSTPIMMNGIAHNFSLSGDIHATLTGGSTEIPEPATMGLLFSGLLGGVAARRRKQKMDLA